MEYDENIIIIKYYFTSVLGEREFLPPNKIWLSIKKHHFYVYSSLVMLILLF